MPAGLLGIEELDRAEIEAILARAKDFQPLQSADAQEAGHAARQDDRQPLLRGLHAHAHQLRDRRQAAGRGRRLDHRVGFQRQQGRIAGGYAEHAGRHAAGRHRDAPRGIGRAALSGAPSAHAHHQRGRRHARTSHAGAARRAHHSGPARNARRPASGHHRRYRAQPRGALQRSPALEVRRRDRAVRAGLAAAGGIGAACAAA